MYTLAFEKRVYKDLDKIPAKDLDKVYEGFEHLKRNPRMPGVKRLRDASDRYRLRKGDYRIVYVIDDKIAIVRIMLVRHRKDVYQKR